jgi:hypothetical protein
MSQTEENMESSAITTPQENEMATLTHSIIEWRKLKERTEEDELRTAIEEVRRAKADDPDNWQESIRLREGIDYWRVGEEPSSATTDFREGLGGEGD